MATEETLVLVKPDGVARGLTGTILARIEAKGYALVDIRLVEPDASGSGAGSRSACVQR